MMGVVRMPRGIDPLPQTAADYGLAIDVKRDYGASGSAATAAGANITAGSTVLTILTASLPTGAGAFLVGHGVGVLGAGAAISIAVAEVPTVVSTGAAGSTSYGYQIVTLDGLGGYKAAGAVGTSATGNATLSGQNYNAINWASVAGAAGYAVYGVATNPATSQGFLGIVSAPSMEDIGAGTQAVPAYLPSTIPVTDQGDTLYATIVDVSTSGNSTNLTLSVAATTSVTTAIIWHDDSTALSNAIAAANAVSGTATVTLSGGHFRVHGGFSIIVQQVMIDGAGGILDWTNASPQTTGITLLGATNVAPAFWAQNHLVQMQRLKLIGPLASPAVCSVGVSSVGIFAGDAANDLPFCTLRNVESQYWDQGLQAADNCWALSVVESSFYQCNIGVNLGNGGLTNAGESLRLTNCTIFENGVGLFLANDSDVYLTSCSLDYNHFATINMSLGHIECMGCHIEDTSRYGSNVVCGNNNNSVLILRGGQIVMNAAGAWTTTFGTTGGTPVIIDSVCIGTGGQYIPGQQFLFGGAGPCIYVGSVTAASNLDLPLPSQTTVDNYNFNIGAGSLVNFVASGNPVPVYDASGGSTGGPGVTFNAASPSTAASSMLSFTVRARPGRYFYMVSHWSTTNIGTSSGWQITVQAVDYAGDIISTLSSPTYGGTNAWGYFFGGTGQLLPAGTDAVKVMIGIANTTGSAALDIIAACVPG